MRFGIPFQGIFRFPTDPWCYFKVGDLEGQNSVWWPMRCNGVYIIRGSGAPILASFLCFIILCDIRVGSNFLR